MDKITLAWNQIEQHYEFLRFIGEQGIGWFAFACTINATAAWALLEHKLTIKTNRIPWTVYFCNVLACLACLALIAHYVWSYVTIARLLNAIAASPASPAFPVAVYVMVSFFMAAVFAVIARQWRYGIRHHRFASKLSVD